MDNKRQLAREYFKEKGLTYSDIKEEQIEKLRELIKYELQTYLPTSDHSRSMDMRLSEFRKKDYKYNKDGTIKFVCIYVAGSYFSFREGVCFNDNGMVGFCGWADGSNTTPIVTAFRKWCDYLSEKKNPPALIGHVTQVYSADFHGVECLESETEYGFEGCYNDDLNHSDPRPAHQIWLKKVHAEKLFKLFRESVK